MYEWVTLHRECVVCDHPVWEVECEVYFNMIQFAINSCFTFNVQEQSIVFGIVLQNSNDVISSFTKE